MLSSARTSRILTLVSHAVLVCGILLGLFYNWFAIANRSHIFLYNHLGAQPFDARTISRYWMTGLVADGFVLIVYTLVNWFWGRVRGIAFRPYQPPSWWLVWLTSAIPVSVGIGWIVTTQNIPTMPPSVAVKIVAAALIGLVPALMPARFAAISPALLMQVGLAGAGLVPALLLLRVWELVPIGDISVAMALTVGMGSTVAGAGWLFLVVRQLARRHISVSAWGILLGGISWSYLILPLVHYLLLTPSAYRYISVADNFFAETTLWQVVSWGVAIGLSFVATHICIGSER